MLGDEAEAPPPLLAGKGGFGEVYSAEAVGARAAAGARGGAGGGAAAAGAGGADADAPAPAPASAPRLAMKRVRFANFPADEHDAIERKHLEECLLMLRSVGRSRGERVSLSRARSRNVPVFSE